MSFPRVLRTFKFCTTGNVINNSQISKVIICNCYQNYFYSNKSVSKNIYEKDPQTGEIKKKKSTILPKITLLSQEQISVTTLEDAQKLAKRRDLKLVKIVDIDTKTQRPLFKLMTGPEYHEEDLKQRERTKLNKQNSSFKGEKVLIINRNISEHDLQIHVAKILKLLTKKYEVRVVLNGDLENTKKVDNVYLFLEKNLKAHGRILQKRQKGSDLKFQVLPPKEENTKQDGKTL